MRAASPRRTSRTWRRTSRASNARTLVLFGGDLRLDDHAALGEAARHGAIVPAIVVEPARLAALGRNPRRAAYWCGAVAALADDVAARGARLICRRGDGAAAILRLARDARASGVTWAARYDARGKRADSELQSVLEEAGLRATIVHDAPAVAPDDTAALRSSDGGLGYRSFSAYYAAWSALTPEPLPTVRALEHVDLASDPLPDARECGAAASDESPSAARAAAAFERYLGGAVYAYRSARNVPSAGATSRCSAALSFGLLSARSAVARTNERLRDRFLLAEERSSLAAFRQALARRDFFLQLAWFFEDAPDAVLQPRMRSFPFARTHPHFAAWQRGETGYALVDAGQRELAATGWMHPRVRLVAASFLCFDLGIDWRAGRDHWDGLLVEDDPALAAGNWQWVAGVGADLAQYPRIYNPRKQARAIDAAGAYVRRWIPELAAVPNVDLFDGRSRTPRAQLTLPLFATTAYPAPVLEHEPVARAFLARYVAFARAAPRAGTDA